MHVARALLDSSSQTSFITEELANKLKLSKIDSNLAVSGINNLVSQIRHRCNVTLYSICNDFNVDIYCYVIKQITGKLPDMRINKIDMRIPGNIKLADPNFEIPERIDILIGADVFWKLLCVGQINLGPDSPILQKTRFGWIIAGPINNFTQKTVCNFSKNIDVQDDLSKFWEIEEIDSRKPHSVEEELCEMHFSKNFTRDQDGRFIASIPFKDSLQKLGESRNLAVKRFYQLENKLQADETLRKLYVDFLREYESLGHMTKCDGKLNDNVQYYMSHHGVLRESRLTTKLRVVFYASACTTSGLSLNDLQMTGPVI
ncbi:uncharacterized protein LOC108910517 [Anoplophora glabripennis]|uniref:uncharacterized protein LOC108910517 n=1 Tax=Anoplophora glabripennis TaxID=217634 RepID=UPI000873E3FA|nr:uncharacterized protein LOC108910517 [Anoplophora glabripennis]